MSDLNLNFAVDKYLLAAVIALNGALDVGVGDEGCSGIGGRAVCSPDAGESGFETDSSLTLLLTDSSLKIIIIKIGSESARTDLY